MTIPNDYRQDNDKDNKTKNMTKSKEAVGLIVLSHPDVWIRPSTTTTTIPRGLPFGRIKIMLVATSSTLCHSVALDVRVRAYGWGRNEYYQLESLSLSLSLSL